MEALDSYWEYEPAQFVVDNDGKADWVIRKIAEHRAERDRLIDHYQRQIQAAKEDCMHAEQRLTALLIPWFDAVPAKKTKTMTAYKLPSGRVLIKHQQPEYKRDEKALAAWLKESGRGEYVRVETVEKPDWASVKALTETHGASVVIKETGEVVEGVTAIERGDEFVVEV